MLHRMIVVSLGILCLVGLGTTLGASTQNLSHDPNRPEAIPIVVSPDGFLRTTFSLPPGSFVFVALNRTGWRDITVYLERMAGNTVAGAVSQQVFGEAIGVGKTRFVKSATLTPGTYRLRVANRPGWVCAIQVQ